MRTDKLHYGPYSTPEAPIGSEVLCAVRGLQVVKAYHGPKQWPCYKGGERPGLLVYGDLHRALSLETVEAIALYWGVHETTVVRWRQRLGLLEHSRAGSAIKAEQMTRKRSDRPDLHVEPGKKTVTAFSPEQRRRNGLLAHPPPR